MHQAAKPFGYGWRFRIAKSDDAAAKVFPNQREDLHNRNLVNNAADMAAAAKTSVHCQ